MGITLNIASPATAGAPAPAAAQKGDDAASEGLGALFSLLISLIDGTNAATPDTETLQQSSSFLNANFGQLQLDVQSDSDVPADADAANDLSKLVQDLLDKLRAASDAVPEGSLKTSIANGSVDASTLDDIGQAVEALANYVQNALPAAALSPQQAEALTGATQPVDPQTKPVAVAKLDFDALTKLANSETDLKALAASLKDVAPALSEKISALVEASDKARVQAGISLPTDRAAPQQADAASLSVLKAVDGDGKAKPVSELGKAQLAVPPADTDGTKPVDAGPKADAPQRADPSQKTSDAQPAAQAKNDPAGTATATSSASADDGLAGVQNQSARHSDLVAQMRPAAAAYQASGGALNVPAVAYEMARQMRNGFNRFQIRLDPPEMGKIDVRMDIDKSGSLHARLTVERAETLDLLQRDSKVLERALQQAGIENSRTNLEFSLKQNPFSRQDNPGQDGSNLFDLADLATDSPADADPVPQIIFSRGGASPGGINLFV